MVDDSARSLRSFLFDMLTVSRFTILDLLFRVMKDPITTPGKTYAVTSPNGCTVTTEDGLKILTVQPGIQAVFTAPAGKVLVSDDAAIVTEMR